MPALVFFFGLSHCCDLDCQTFLIAITIGSVILCCALRRIMGQRTLSYYRVCVFPLFKLYLVNDFLFPFLLSAWKLSQAFILCR